MPALANFNQKKMLRIKPTRIELKQEDLKDYEKMKMQWIVKK